jgi:hypothetical protein
MANRRRLSVSPEQKCRSLRRRRRRLLALPGDIDFADASENTDERFTSYHVVAGAEYAVKKWLWVAGEARYTSVPDAIGAPGIAGELMRRTWGDLVVAVKVLVGR